MRVFCGERLIADKVMLADSFYKRFIGLMGRKSLRTGAGLLLINCGAIHTFFMRMTIDAVYLSREFKVLGVETLKPWRLGGMYKGSAHVLELKGCSVCLKPGEQLKIT